jgi:hypothetical protein
VTATAAIDSGIDLVLGEVRQGLEKMAALARQEMKGKLAATGCSEQEIQHALAECQAAHDVDIAGALERLQPVLRAKFEALLNQ